MAKDTKKDQPAAEAAQANQPAFGIEKLYVKDASIEVPNAPQVYTERTAPQVSVELGNSAQKLDADV